MSKLEKIPCGCWVEVLPERAGKQTAIIDATSFLCRGGHVQGQAVAYPTEAFTGEEDGKKAPLLDGAFDPQAPPRASASSLGSSSAVSACVSCGEERPDGECSQSKRPCAHHCNHSWSHDECCWCGESMLGEPAGVPAEPATEDAYPSATAKPTPFVGPTFDADDIAEVGLETCLRTHERLSASSVSAGAGQVPADTIERLVAYIEDAETRRRQPIDLNYTAVPIDGWEKIRAEARRLAALAAVRTPEEQT